MMRYPLFALLGVAIALGLFVLLVSPQHQLNIINRLWAGDGHSQRVVGGAVFDTQNDLALDVWDDPSVPTPEGGKPVLVFFYGGGWANGARHQYGFAGEAFAAKGFVVVMPDYRKVPQIRFPAFMEDGAHAIAWVQKNIAVHGGNPARVTLSGHSAGAHIAMLLTLDQRWLQNAGVDPNVIRAALGLSGPYDFYPFDKLRSIAAFGKWPKPLDTQPIQFARKDAPPVMLVHGTADTVVRPHNAENLAKALTEAGSVADLRLHAGLDHNDIVMALSRVFRSKAPVLDDGAAFLLANSNPAQVP
jgi:acetyl esterase/lipase